MMPKTQRSTNPIILTLIVLMGFIVGYFYYRQATADETFEVPVSSALRDKNYLKFKDLKFDFSLFSNSAFSSLRNIGDFPIEPGITGKDNPFAPF